ncbi:MAG: PAS domain-containing protein [Treponema sp.]|jgi:iron only hydrogenase large subunit-like protein|nr:PAS domain-containing protein [Treponema sp.]
MPGYLKLKTEDCKNCYKCIRHCPVKSIKFSDNQAHIIDDECILCGNCFVSCPQKAKEIRSDIEAASALLKSGAPVYVSVAPSFVANYAGASGGASLASLEAALKKLGFAGAEETVLGATLVKRQYDAMIEQEEQDVIISSCCPSVNLLIQKYYPGALPFIAPVLSPMQAHCLDIKRRFPGAKALFAGPCISKKAEAESYPGAADCVLTFAELSRWMEQKNISPITVADRDDEDKDFTLTRAFPTSGGILYSMEKKNPRYAYLVIEGIDNCKTAIEDLLKSQSAGGKGKCFIEMSACAGSCIGGPVMERHNSPVRDYLAVRSVTGKKDFKVKNLPPETLRKKFNVLEPRRIHFGEKAINDILQKIGKTRPEDELNCGTCGYNTCREKARAVLEGKASLTMCLPYLVGKAESFSDGIIKNTPNGIIVLNENLEVQQINGAACRLMNITAADILGDQVVRILDPAPFLEVCRREQNSYLKDVYLADYGKHADQTIIYDKSYHIIICIMRDITEEAKRRETKDDFSRNAMEITDRVIEKQMRTVQEIASLLGETTAETKIALSKLKESLLNDSL